jgi:hypothetical protein
LFFGNKYERRDTALLIPKYCEHISTTALIDVQTKRKLQKAFDHANCVVKISERQPLIVRGNQGMRNMRHRLGCKEDSYFASCHHCGQEFTYENMVGLYCQQLGNIQVDNGVGEMRTLDATSISKNRIYAMCMSFPKKVGRSIDGRTKMAINAAYNSHSSSHVSGCFRCQKTVKKQACLWVKSALRVPFSFAGPST